MTNRGSPTPAPLPGSEGVYLSSLTLCARAGSSVGRMAQAFLVDVGDAVGVVVTFLVGADAAVVPVGYAEHDSGQ